MTSRDEFADDTEYLLSSPANAENLRQSIEEIRSAQAKVRDRARAEVIAALREGSDPGLRAEVEAALRDDPAHRAKVEAMLREASQQWADDPADLAEIQQIQREMNQPAPEVIDRIFDASRRIAEATQELNRLLAEAWGLDG